MSHFIRLIVVCVAVVSALSALAQPNPLPDAVVPEPAQTFEGDGIQVGLYFDVIQQGRVGLMRVTGDALDLSARVLGRDLLFWQPDSGQTARYAFITAPIDQGIRTYELTVDATYADDSSETLSIPVQVESGGFIRQEVFLTDEATRQLLNPEVEAAEFEQIFTLADPQTPERLWESGGFIPPVDAPLTSPFGAVRVFNGSYDALHTGWDFNAAIGRPMKAMASWRVVFAGQMAIRGNYVLIDHGYGIYTGYAHLSVVHVTEGQAVRSGQIIGQVGTTGRSSSAHAHVEVISDGEWVDTADFIRMYIP